MPVYLSVLAVGIGLKAHLNKPQLWRVQFESVADGLETLGSMLYGGNKHIFEVCLLKEVQIHVQYIMSIWKYLEPANRSMHAFFLSPLINLLPLPVLASVSKRDWFLVPIRLFILPNCVYRH